MYVTVATLLALQCNLCLTIRVPVAWNDENSEVLNKQFAFDQFAPQNVASSNQKAIPTEYFQYTAQKPKFAVDIAKSHGVQAPENHYKAYAIKPHTGVPKPELGKYQLPNKQKNVFHEVQEPVKKNEAIRNVAPSSTSYEVFHPYKLEEPALKELYQDPVMAKIRNDLENNKIRLQKYEKEAGQPDITKEDYLESPEETDRKKVPHKNVPAPYEIHRPQRRPVYYRPPNVHNQREQILNQKLRHPWQQNYIKVKPAHYHPIKNHLQRLRQQHALTYDDERNEYPQLPIPEKQSEPPEGFDIYEKGKANFDRLRNNFDESLSDVVQKNKPTEKQQLEEKDGEYNEDKNIDDDDEDDFVPVKNYAQVRKTETTKHLPKEAAYHDADTLEEIQNAPRLREAIKSTKAQTVYSEEGYEDSAYDHAGEQKQASDHEEHKGSLKQKEASKGKFKSPTVSDNFEDEEGSEYRNQVEDVKKWKDKKHNTDKEIELEEYVENEGENSEESDNYTSDRKEKLDNGDDDRENYDSREENIKRIKRDPTNIDNVSAENIENVEKDNLKDDDIKSEREIKNQEINSTKINKEISKLEIPQPPYDIKEKYPYYYNKIKGINQDSPLRYAENLKFIPNKSKGGTEFYDSRAKFECPEVEDNIDPIPDKLKKGSHPDDDEESKYDEAEESHENESSDEPKQVRRLKGLGDKIDCFKAKYFGENPLDSPFFNEEIIPNPEPVLIPSIDIYRLKQEKQQSLLKSKIDGEKDEYTELSQKQNNNMFILSDKLYPKQTLQVSIPNSSEANVTHQSISLTSESDKTLQVISNNQNTTLETEKLEKPNESIKNENTARRKKRAAPFVYEPYKIIRDSQIQDSKKTTTTNNISPLIKQLQSSRVVDKVTTNTGKDQIVKRSTGTRSYKDIGKNEREKTNESKGSQPIYDASFVDVNVDQRRGEPRYELRPANHKSQSAPIENKKSTTVEEQESQTKSNTQSANQQGDKSQSKRRANRRRRTTTTRPYFDVSKFLPQDKIDESDSANGKTIQRTDQPTSSQSDKSSENNESKEPENDDHKDNVQETTSTTSKILSRRKITDTSTLKPETVEELPKLRLVTRFRNYQTEKSTTPTSTEISPRVNKDGEKKVPKYREKKKKISKSTLVTDTNSYGEDDDDDDDLSKEEEVDALIGVNHNIEEYIPTYEIETNKKDSPSGDSHSESQDSDEDYEDDNHNYENEDDDGDENDHEDDDDEEDDEEDEDDDEEVEEDLKPELTTPEPTKRTLIRTTEAPLATTEARSAKLEIEPVMINKRLEIHKELPVNRALPHITEFKQDIKAVETIKEIPSRKKNKPQKNIEALELYKDENLAKDINKLGGVEVFKEGLDLINGPKHGGNYRIAENVNADDSPSLGLQKNEKSPKADVVASPSKTSKIIDTKKDAYSRRRSDIQRARNSRGRSAKLIELSEATEHPTSRPMHGGNFKSIHDVQRRGRNRNSKLVELIEPTSRDDHSTNKHEGNSKSYGSRGGERHQMHGGNYRSAKLTNADTTSTETEKEPLNDGIQTAVSLNSFERTVVTTPLPYILDPSKRMYYYVEK